MLITTLIVVAVLTSLIFMLAIMAMHFLLKAERQEIASGYRDGEIMAEGLESKKKSSKALNLTSNIICGIIALFMLLAAGIGIAYKASNGQIVMSNNVSLVIVSDSMSKFYNSPYETELTALKEDAEKDQFNIGDLTMFSKVSEDDELQLFDVYGYRAKSGKTITHRYIGTTDDGFYIFRGDNAKGRDSYVSRSQVTLHYEGKKISRIGYFILFTQSGFGLYSLISVIGVYAIAEIYLALYNKLIKGRLNEIWEIQRARQAPEFNPSSQTVKKKTNKRLVHFTTYDGRKVKFYIRGK